MRLPILSFVAGVFWLQQQPLLANIRWWPAWLLLLLVALWVESRSALKWRVPAVMAAMLAAGMLGVAWASWTASVRLADDLPAAMEGRDVAVVGAIANLPQETERGTRFEFHIETVITPDASVPRRVSLTWYHEVERSSGIATPAPALRPGERWQLTLRLRRPHGSVNPHGFDYEAWALERGIRATGYVRVKGVNQRQADSATGFTYRVNALRATLRERLRGVLGDAPYAGVLVALAIGDQNAIPREQWQTFWRTGVGHLMSISGLHITMVASLVYLLVFALWARLPLLAARFPAQKAGVMGGFLAAASYALIAGFSIPTQRTLCMLGVVAVALWLNRASAPSRVLCWAVLIVLLFDPWAVLSPGFWLSFGAIALIFYVTASRTGQLSVLRGAVVTQVAITLGMLPMLLALFQEVSVVSPLANAFAIPFVSLVVVPVTLIAAVVPIDALLHLAHALASVAMWPLEWLAASPGALWESHAPAWWAVLLALLGGAWLLAPRGWPARWLGFVWLAPLFLVMPAKPPLGEAHITVLDVGHGLATVVRTTHHALVYDTGPKWTEDADSGSRIVVPHLRGEGIRKLDGVVVSHDDEDHSGGARSIMAARDVGWLMSSLPAESALVAQARDARRCEAGDKWEWDDVQFQVLHPAAASYDAPAIKDNDRSCVLRIFAMGKSVLLTGDIEKRAELELLAAAEASLKSDVMIVPHHGSKTSSTAGFIAAVAPTVGILPVGYRNRFRHPHPDVVARYAAAGVKLLRTDESGALSFHLGEGPLTVVGQRETRRRYWHDAPRIEAGAE